MRRIRWIWALSIFVVCLLIFFYNLPAYEYFHRDEANFTRVSIYSFRTFFIERDFSNEGWSKSFRAFGSRYPQIGKFVIGASLWLHGYRDFEGVVRYEGSKNLEWHIEQGIAPPPEELYAARFPIAILAAGTAVLIFALAGYAQRAMFSERGLLGGILAVLFFVFHPLTQSLGRRASVDMPAVFFSTLAMALAVMSGLAFMRGMRRRGLISGLGVAIATGLAISTKMNALLIWPIVLLAAVWIVWRHLKSHNGGSMRLSLACVAFLLGAPISVFVLSNPFLYSNTVSGIRHLFQLSDIVAGFRANYTRQALFTIQGKLKAFADFGFGSLEHLLHIENVDILMVGIGIVIMGYVLLRTRSDGEPVFVGSILLLWTALTGLSIVLWSPLAWGRYYFPWIPISSVWEGVGVAWLLTALSKILHERPPLFRRSVSTAFHMYIKRFEVPPKIAERRSSPWFGVIRGTGIYILCWLVAPVVPVLLLGVSPLATLGLAALGGLFLGRETARAFEGGFARERPSETSPTRAAIWHWLIVGAIGLNYAWFVFTDRPFVPGVLFLIALIVLRWIRTRSLFPPTPLDLPIAVLLLLATLFSAVISAKTSLSYPKLYGVAFSIVLFYEVVHGLQQKGNLIRWLVILHLLGLAIAGLGLVGTDWFLNKVVDLSEVYALIPQKIVDVPRSLQGGFHPNGIAGTLIYLIPLYAITLKGRLLEPLRHRWLYTGLIALTLASTVLTLLLTQSRGALAGLSIACVALFFALKGRFRWSLLSLACLLLVWLLFMAYLPLLANALNATEHPAMSQLLRSYNFRQRVWRLGLKVLETFPLRSAGIGTFDHVARYMFPNLYVSNPRYLRYLLSNRHSIITHAHNELLQVAIDLGIPGLVAYVALLAAFVRTAWRAYTWASDERIKRLILGLGTGMLAHQIFGLTDAFMLGTKPGVVMWIIMGLVTGLYLNLAPDHLETQGHEHAQPTAPAGPFG